MTIKIEGYCSTTNHPHPQKRIEILPIADGSPPYHYHYEGCPIHAKSFEGKEHPREKVMLIGSTYAPGPECTPRCHTKLYGVEISYEGAVLCTREENGPQDSDWYAIVWDEPKQKLLKVYYASTRFHTPAGQGASVDATPEVKAKAAHWLLVWYLNELQKANAQQAKEPKEGRWVTVVSGRKVPQGTIGQVTWAGSCKGYGYPRRLVKRARVQPQNGGEAFFIDARHLVVLEPEKHLKTDDHIRAKADRLMKRPQWHHPFTIMPVVV